MEEFRINNYIVDYETEPYYFKIEEIKRNEQGNLACYYRNGSCWSISPDRVELTEEILLKCGFEKHNKEFWFKDFFIGLIDNSFNLKEGIGVYVADVYYLHQLQNLYFALTGEELTVNL